MTEQARPPLERWTHRQVHAAPSEAKSQTLFRQTHALTPPDLSPAAWGRISQAVDRQAVRPNAKYLAGAGLVGAFSTAAVALGLWAFHTVQKPLPAAPPTVLAPLGLAWQERVDVTLLGPAQFRSTDPLLYHLAAGLVEMQTHAKAASVKTPQGDISVAPYSRVAIRATSQYAEVAAFEGAATASWQGMVRSIAVRANTSCRSNRPQISPVVGLQALLDALASSPLAEPNESPKASATWPSPIATHLVGKLGLPARPPKLLPQIPLALPSSPIDSLREKESAVLRQGLAALARGEPHAALSQVRRYRLEFPEGQLQEESTVLELQALLKLGEQKEALALLDRLALHTLSRTDSLHLLRGELRLAASRYQAAWADFDAAQNSSDVAVQDDAAYGQALCQAHLGDSAGAKKALGAYLEHFPEGRHVTQAKDQLRER